MHPALSFALGLGLLGVNFFFVLAEFALVRLRASRVSELIDAGDRRAIIIQRIQAHMDVYLSVVQVGITGATLGIGVLIEDSIATPIANLFGVAGSMGEVMGHIIGFLVATYLVVTTSELLPKALALRYPEQVSLWCARPMVWCRNALYPLLWLLTRSAMVLLSMLRLQRSTDDAAHSEDELRIILNESQTTGVMSFRRLLFMENIFELGELKVRDAMRVKASVKVLVTDQPWDDSLQIMRTARYSRYPVLRHADDLLPLGVVHIKDVLLAGHERNDLAGLVRPYLTTTEQSPLESLLSEMQRRRIHVAIVTNAAGTWTGFITMEDIIEEIIGTVEDEFAGEPPITLADVLTPGRIQLGIEADHLRVALDLALQRLPSDDLPIDKASTIRAVLDREKLAGTYMGKGLALPHARLPGLPNPVLVVIRSEFGIPVEGTTDKAYLLFLLLTPAGMPRMHQRLQARIAGLIENSSFVVDRIREAPTALEVLEVIRTGEQAALD